MCQNKHLASTRILTKKAVDDCGGELYWRCYPSRYGFNVPHDIGMCFNTRMEVISCSFDADQLELRRLQIERNLGPHCSASVESWLGCST